MVEFEDGKIEKVDLSKKRSIIITLKNGEEISLFIDEIEHINELIKIDKPTTDRRY